MDRTYIIAEIERVVGKKKLINLSIVEQTFPQLNDDELSEIIRILEDENFLVIDEEIEIEDENDKLDESEVLVDLDSFKNFTNAQLCALYQKGDDKALEALLKRNHRYVYQRAKYYKSRFNPKVEIDDLLQVGDMGLCKAAQMFNTSYGYAFLTYATFWINQHITRYIADEGYIIRIPVHAFERLMKILRLKYLDISSGVNQETIIRISADMGMTVDDVETYLHYARNIMAITSIDEKIGEDKESTLESLLEDTKIESPEHYVDRMGLKAEINATLENLTEREEKVIRLRFGLIDGRIRTLEEVGKLFGVTRERIRQIEAKALRKLKHPNRSSQLRAYLEENSGKVEKK